MSARFRVLLFAIAVGIAFAVLACTPQWPTVAMVPTPAPTPTPCVPLTPVPTPTPLPQPKLAYVLVDRSLSYKPLTKRALETLSRALREDNVVSPKSRVLASWIGAESSSYENIFFATTVPSVKPLELGEAPICEQCPREPGISAAEAQKCRNDLEEWNKQAISKIDSWKLDTRQALGKLKEEARKLAEQGISEYDSASKVGEAVLYASEVLTTSARPDGREWRHKKLLIFSDLEEYPEVQDVRQMFESKDDQGNSVFALRGKLNDVAVLVAMFECANRPKCQFPKSDPVKYVAFVNSWTEVFTRAGAKVEFLAVVNSDAETIASWLRRE